MAARTLAVMTPTLSGASIASISTVMASSDTCTISANTAQSVVDVDRMFVRATNLNTATSVILTLSVGTEFSAIGIGTKAITIATATSVLGTGIEAESIIIGGHDFESARFLSSGGTIVFTATGTGPTILEAYQPPRATE